MKCEEFLERSLLLSQGLLNDEDAQLVKAHIDNCSSCNEETKEINQIGGLVKKSSQTTSHNFERALDSKLRTKKSVLAWIASAAAAVVLSVAMYFIIVKSPSGEPEEIMQLGPVIKRHIKSMELFAIQAKNLKINDPEKDIKLLKGDLGCSGLEETEKILCRYEPELKSYNVDLPSFVKDSSSVIKHARESISKKSKEAVDAMKNVIKQSRVVERAKDLSPKFDKYGHYNVSCDTVINASPEIEKFISARKYMYDQDIKSAKKGFSDYKAQFSFAPYTEYANFWLGTLSLSEGALNEAIEFYFHVEDEDLLEEEEEAVKQEIMKKAGIDAKKIEGKFLIKGWSNEIPMPIFEKMSLKFGLEDFIFTVPETSRDIMTVQLNKSFADNLKLGGLAKDFPNILEIKDKKSNVVISINISQAMKDKEFVKKAEKLFKETPLLGMMFFGSEEPFEFIPEDEEGRGNQFFFNFGFAFGYDFEEKD